MCLLGLSMIVAIGAAEFSNITTSPANPLLHVGTSSTAADPCAQHCTEVGCKTFCMVWLPKPICYGVLKPVGGQACSTSEPLCAGQNITCSQTKALITSTNRFDNLKTVSVNLPKPIEQEFCWSREDSSIAIPNSLKVLVKDQSSVVIKLVMNDRHVIGRNLDFLTSTSDTDSFILMHRPAARGDDLVMVHAVHAEFKRNLASPSLTFNVLTNNHTYQEVTLTHLTCQSDEYRNKSNSATYKPQGRQCFLSKCVIAELAAFGLCDMDAPLILPIEINEKEMSFGSLTQMQYKIHADSFIVPIIDGRMQTILASKTFDSFKGISFMADYVAAKFALQIDHQKKGNIIKGFNSEACPTLQPRDFAFCGSFRVNGKGQPIAVRVHVKTESIQFFLTDGEDIHIFSPIFRLFDSGQLLVVYLTEELVKFLKLLSTKLQVKGLKATSIRVRLGKVMKIDLGSDEIGSIKLSKRACKV